MTLDQFWAIIEPGKAAEDPTPSLQKALAKLTPAEIVSFEQHFFALFNAAYQWKLWGAAYLIEGGCSDDGFTDFRYGLISRGRAVYEAALKDPDSLVTTRIESNEDYGYVAQKVYEEKTGEEEMPGLDDAWPEEPAGEQWDFDDPKEMSKRLPKLWKSYGSK